MENKLLQILACPKCKGELIYDKEKQELRCKIDRLAYPIINEIPVMLMDKARQITEE